ncbi:MAG: sigma 54-interacting transcriptional regulator [Syntrophothermus sp.]|uniref:sigma 54-interacting transcriptional regulator n=1 Tax=Syntrophothermus sp. TaxID=2736299 RepID=UPI00257D0201|nr:sigma 54-interacting transcriptional regulator [Syntrophothermus sp.]NSW83897.1 sigma 54-interacting transcriptional regulator [Syntrophothermus sp.]
MKLAEIMTPDPIMLSPCMTAREAARVFSEHRIDSAPVVDQNQRLVGLLTKSHLLRVLGQGLSPEILVEQIMTRDVQTCSPEDELDSIIYPDRGRYPVVDGDKVVGMVTRTNLLRVFFDSYHKLSTEFETILNSTHNLIISIDEYERIEVFNRAAEEVLGVKAGEVRGKKITDVIPSSGLGEVVKSGRPETLQKVELNGRTLVSNRTPIIKDGKIIGAVAVLQDMSEIEEISKELKYVKELNEELNAVFESSFDGLYIADGNGITLRLNKAFERITGINGREFLNRNVEDIVEEGIVSESVTAQVLKQRQPVTIIQLYAKTGKTTLATGTPVFDKKGNIFRVVCNVRDVTELNMLKQRLEQVEGLSEHYEKQLRTLRLQYAGSGKMVVRSPRMRDLMETIIRVAQVDSTVLITGESGTGKELLAETIHANSARKDGPFIKVNCGAIPESLLESELFGYDAGAFTGARKEGKAGYFELANGGTLFLDEIGDLPLNLQVKLLRVIQSREIVRVGGIKPLKVDIRIVAATNRNLVDMIRRKEFREDLYYRLNVVPVNVPPLRQRKEEIPSLVVHFLQVFNRKYKQVKRISPEVIDLFMEYDWPGNVRELENLMERLVVITPSDTITVQDLPSHFGNLAKDWSNKVHVLDIVPLREAVESVEKQILEKAYVQFRTTRQMARALKVDASTVVRKAAKYGIGGKQAVWL